MKTMRALVFRQYGPPSVVSVGEVDRPAVGPNDVLVRNEASIISAAETAARSGSPFVARLYFGLRRPKWSVLGNNFAGTIEQIGTGVTRFAVGDRVAGLTPSDKFGAHAEYVCVAESGAIIERPAGMSAADAAALFDGGLTALPFVRDGAQLRAGQRVLINGASGAVGTAAVQLARHFGAHVTAVCSAGNHDLVTQLGANEVIDYTTADFTQARGRYDVIVDAVGKSTYRRCRASLTARGIYLTTVPTPAIMMQMLVTTRFTKRTARIVFAGLRKPSAMADDLATLAALAADGVLVPVIDRFFAVHEGAQAHAYVDTQRKRGSAVITFA